MVKSSKLKIIQLFVPGPIGGAEKVLLTGSKAIQDLGYDSPIWVIKESRVPELADTFLSLANESKIKTEEFSCDGRFDFKLMKELKKRFMLERPSVIHAHGAKGILYATLCRPKGSKLIVTHHGNTGHTRLVKIYEYIEKLGMKKADQVIAVSNQMKKDLISQGLRDTKVHTVENMLSFEVTKREIPCNEKLELVFIARLSIEKGCDLLLRAIADSKLDIKLTVIGDGTQRQNLEQLSNDLSLTDKVDFVGFQKDVRPFLAKSDALIMPSLREGLPMTLIEACCMGLPVLGSNVGGIPDLVSKDNGILMQAGSIKSIQNSIESFNMQKESYLKNADLISEKFIQKFHPSNWAKETIKIYNL